MPDQLSKRDGDQHEHVAVDRARTDFGFGFFLRGFVCNIGGDRCDAQPGADDGVRSTVRRQIFPNVDLIDAGYIGWRGVVEEGAHTRSTHAAIFHRFAWGLLDREHILGYPVPGALDDLTPGAGGLASSGTALSTPQRRLRRCRPTPRAGSIPKASRPS
jgi:hypothetical protein